MKKVDELNKAGQLTDMEAEVMNYLLTDGYYAEKYYSDLEVPDVAKAVGKTTNVMRGVISSLVQKDYLFLEEMDGCGTFVYATDKGYQLDDNYMDRWGDEIYR